MVIPQTIVFRCDASATIGSGHVMRCLTLAKQLAKRGDKITFLCSDETLQTVAALRTSPYKIIHAEEMDYADWLIVDHYGLDATYEAAARAWAKNIFVIDDLANRPHDCDVLLDQTYGRKREDYAPRVYASTITLLGSDYALLREEFTALRSKIDRTQTQNHVLVSFGGVNPKQCTELSLRMLQSYTGKKLTIDVVAGANAAGLEGIRNIAGEINDDGVHAATLHIDTTDIAEMMMAADLCLGAGGTTSWERCCLGLPTLALELADNQAPTLNVLHGAGALCNLGKIEDLTPEAYLDGFSAMISSPDKLQSMSAKAMTICDGRGAERVAASILPIETSKDGKQVRLRAANADDTKTVFDWQCAPGVRTHARNPDAPTWDGHKSWFLASLSNPDRKMFIVLHDGQPAGFTRLDREKGEIYEVSILISPDFQGKGLGAAALKLLRSAAPFATFRAEILPSNRVSHKIFDKVGYRPLDGGWYISNPME